MERGREEGGTKKLEEGGDTKTTVKKALNQSVDVTTTQWARRQHWGTYFPPKMYPEIGKNEKHSVSSDRGDCFGIASFICT